MIPFLPGHNPMKSPLTKRGIGSVLAVQAAAALMVAALSACSGGSGADDSEKAPVRDISPHQLVPEGATAAELYVLGTHITMSGWEIGTDPQADGGDPTELPLRMTFRPDGTMSMILPLESVRDAAELEVNPAYEGPPFEGTWQQSDHVATQHNRVMYINFRATGTIPTTNQAAHPDGYIHCTATGQDICLHLRWNFDPSVDRSSGEIALPAAAGGVDNETDYVCVGDTIRGKLTLEGLFQEENSQGTVGGGDFGPEPMHVYVKNPEYNLISEPCFFIVRGWRPEDAE